MSGHTPWSEIRHKGEDGAEPTAQFEACGREIDELLEAAELDDVERPSELDDTTDR